MTYIRKVRLTCLGGSLSIRETDYLPEEHRKTRPAKDTYEEGYGDGDDMNGNTTIYERRDLTTSLESRLVPDHEFCPDGKVTRKEARGL
jgi:hypothetical protein